MKKFREIAYLLLMLVLIIGLLKFIPGATAFWSALCVALVFAGYVALFREELINSVVEKFKNIFKKKK